MTENILSMRHLVFRKNHIDGYLIITSAFNRDKQKGFTMCEHINPLSHFIPKGQTDRKEHITEKECVEYHNYVYDKWTEQYNKLDKDTKDSEFESERTCLMTFNFDNRKENPKQVSFCIRTPQTIFLMSDIEKNLVSLNIGTELQNHLPESWQITNHEPCRFCIDIGTDPTPREANSVVSLGYSNVRLETFVTRVESKSPVQLVGPAMVDIIEAGVLEYKENFRLGINRPLRRPQLGGK